jgi:hypothetical protein
MSPRTLTTVLLGCGAVAGPLFIGAVLAQDYTRPGVDPRAQDLSLLTLGELGWIQIGAFVVAGLLNVAFAAGIRRVLPRGPARIGGPLLIGGYGLGLVAAGVFVPDPSFGFPPGTPAGAPATMSLSAQLHDHAATVVFGCLVAATAVFARRFAVRGEMLAAVSSAAVGVALFALVVIALDPGRSSEALRAAVLLGWGWAAWLALRLNGSPATAASPSAAAVPNH